MLVSDAPEPEKVVAAKTPVDGLKVNLDEAVLIALFPELALTKVT